AEEVLAVRQRVLAGIENIGVVDMCGRIRDAVEVPVEDPGVEQRIAEVGGGGVEAKDDGPGHENREKQEEAEGARLAQDADSERMRVVHAVTEGLGCHSGERVAERGCSVAELLGD